MKTIVEEVIDLYLEMPKRLHDDILAGRPVWTDEQYKKIRKMYAEQAAICMSLVDALDRKYRKIQGETE